MSRSILRIAALIVFGFVAAAALFIATASSTPLPAHRHPTSAEDLAKIRNGESSFPKESWAYADPAELGWSVEALEAARRWAEDLDTSALFVVHRGWVVADWGANDTRYLTQSIRKSLLSGLIGRLVSSGQLDLDATLADLDIDERPALTPQERQATVRQMLLSRSGVYRSALYEAPGWKRRKPDRGSHAPGESWFYNNWSFNALGTIFERASGMRMGDAFESWIAEPIGMQDFRAKDVTYLTSDHLTERIMGNASDHQAYMFNLSSRDLARFGLLYAQGGLWRDEQILSAEWVEESTFGAAQPTGWDDLSYSYMWWKYPPRGPFREPTLVARGGRGHRLVIAPELDLILVHRVPVRSAGFASQLYRRFVWSPSITPAELDELFARIVAAHPDRQKAVRPDLAGKRPVSSPSPA